MRVTKIEKVDNNNVEFYNGETLIRSFEPTAAVSISPFSSSTQLIKISLQNGNDTLDFNPKDVRTLISKGSSITVPKNINDFLKVLSDSFFNQSDISSITTTIEEIKEDLEKYLGVKEKLFYFSYGGAASFPESIVGNFEFEYWNGTQYIQYSEDKDSVSVNDLNALPAILNANQNLFEFYIIDSNLLPNAPTTDTVIGVRSKDRNIPLDFKQGTFALAFSGQSWDSDLLETFAESESNVDDIQKLLTSVDNKLTAAVNNLDNIKQDIDDINQKTPNITGAGSQSFSGNAEESLSGLAGKRGDLVNIIDIGGGVVAYELNGASPSNSSPRADRNRLPFNIIKNVALDQLRFAGSSGVSSYVVVYNIYA